MSKRGRPRKGGDRDKAGRLRVVVDRGNDKVQQRAHLFRACQGGKAGGQIGDSVGRLWAVGLLDCADYDAAMLRDAARLYGKLYWSNYADLAPKMGKAERSDRSGSRGADTDPTGERFMRMDESGRRRGRDAYAAMQQICVDEWWFPDADVPWVGRLVDAALRHKEPDFLDRVRLTLAKQGLCALLDGPSRASTNIPFHRLTAA